MGAVDDAMEAGRAERRERAAKRAARDKRAESEKGTESLFGTGKTGRGGNRFDWGGESADGVLALIDIVTSRGGAIRFGYSRDGYAGSIGIYWGESRDTLWINPDEGSALVFEKISRRMAELVDTAGKSPQ